MENKVNYTVVGLFVVVLSIGILITALWLTESLERKPFVTYLVYMHESVSGLSTDAAVKYNGVEVGYVDDISLNLKNPQEVVLKLKIEPYVPVTESTEAIMMQQGITGISYIGLRTMNGHKEPLKVKPGQEYPVIRSAPSFMVRLDQSIQNLTDNIDSLTMNVKQVLSQQNIDSLTNTLKNLDEVTTTLSNNRGNIDSSLQSLKVFLDNSANASKDLPQVLDELKQMSGNLSSTALKGNVAITSFNDQLMPKAYNTLENLQQLTSHLQTFSGDMARQPSVIISGKAKPKPGPGER